MAYEAPAKEERKTPTLAVDLVWAEQQLARARAYVATLEDEPADEPLFYDDDAEHRTLYARNGSVVG